MTEKQMYGMRLCVNGPGKRVPTAFSRMAWGKRVSASMIPAEMHNTHEHQAQSRRALAILGMVEMEHPTLPYHPDGDADEHQPYEPYRGENGSTKSPVNQRMPSGLGKPMGERLGHRSCNSDETRITTTSAIPNNNARYANTFLYIL